MAVGVLDAECGFHGVLLYIDERGNITCVLQVTTLSYSFWANKTGNAGEGMLEMVLILPRHVCDALGMAQGIMASLGDEPCLDTPL